jgi:hypothetical protein
MDAGAPSEQAGGDDARIVEDEEFVASQENGKFREEAVFEYSRGTIQEEEPGGFAAVQGPLGDLLSGEMVVEFVQAHGKGQSNSKAGKANKANLLFVNTGISASSRQARRKPPFNLVWP